MQDGTGSGYLPDRQEDENAEATLCQDRGRQPLIAMRTRTEHHFNFTSTLQLTYRMVYELLIVFLNSFDNYDNFKP